MAGKLFHLTHRVKRYQHELRIILVPTLIFVLGQIFLICLSESGGFGLSMFTIPSLQSTPVKTGTELPHTTKYIVGATFGLAFFISIFIGWYCISNLSRKNKTWICWCCLLSLILVCLIFSQSNRSPLTKYIKLVPDNGTGILSQHGIYFMTEIINLLFVFASFALLFSAAALIPETKRDENQINYHGILEIVKQFEKLRVLIVQGSCLWASGMLFMHFWIKYCIEIGTIGNSSQFTDMAYGIEIFNAVSFSTVILSMTVLTHLSLRDNCMRAIDKCNRGEKEELLKELKAKASYYRELATLSGLFAGPLLSMFK